MTPRSRWLAAPAALLAAGALVLAGCAEKEDLTTGGGSTTVHFSGPTAPTALDRAESIDRDKEEEAAAAESARCIGVPGPIAAAVRAGVVRGVRITHLRAVRSDDYARIWMVSGRLEGEGLDGSDTATWATDKFRDRDYTGLVFSVNGFAKEFSDWGELPDSSIDDDGVEESALCALGLR